MRSTIKMALCCVLVLGIVGLAGCKKKGQEAGTEGAKTESVKEAKVQLEVNVEKAISDIKAEAKKLNAEQLKTIAKKYKDAIGAKESELNELMVKMKDAPVTQMLEKEGQALMEEIESLSKAIAALNERFAVYYNNIKELGGDVSGLSAE